MTPAVDDTTLHESIDETAPVVSPALRMNVGGSRPWIGVVGVLGTILLVALTLLAEDGSTIGWLALGLMLWLALLSVPVGAAMGVAGILGIYSITGFEGTGSLIQDLPYNMVGNWSLTVIPMFILMGVALGQSGSVSGFYAGIKPWLSRLPGGLAVTSNVAGTTLDAASGSSVGVVYALGRFSIPEMLAAGYPKRLSIAAILMAGSGQLIPPSLLLVVYSGMAATPVGEQLMSGLVPGLLLHLAYGVLLVGIAVWIGKRRGERLDPLPEKTTFRERMSGLKAVTGVLLVVVVVIGGILTGIFTATEAASIGALVAVMLVFIGRHTSTWAALKESFSETVVATGSIFFLLVGAAVLARFLSLSGLPRDLAEMASVFEGNLWGLMVALIVLYLFLGMFLDTMAMILVTVPILLPLVVDAGMSPIWFGVFVVLMAEISMITPPVGILLFVVHKICQSPQIRKYAEISLVDVIVAGAYVVPVALAFTGLLIAYPELAEWLPGTMGD